MTLSAKRNLVSIIFWCIVAVSLFALSKILTDIPFVMVFGFAVTVMLLIVTFFNPNSAATILIFAMILSPEIPIYSFPRRDVVVRYDDILIIVFFVIRLWKSTRNRDLTLIPRTPLNRPIYLYVIISLLASQFALANGYIRGRESTFFILKYCEYFLVYFLFYVTITTEKQARALFNAFLVAAVISLCYGAYEISEGVRRISLPFEGQGEPNTFGGYLLMIIGLLLCFSLEAPGPQQKAFYTILVVWAGATLIFTYSRASYLGFVAVAVVSMLIARPLQKPILALFLTLFLLVGMRYVPQSVRDRVMLSFNNASVEVAPNIKMNPQDSSYRKYVSTMNTIKEWKMSPALGLGVTGVGLVDAQYVRVLGETGILGVGAFLWFIFTLFLIARNAFLAVRRNKRPDMWKWRAVVNGYLIGLIGLLIHAIGANTFVLIRVMEPLMFLTALMAVLPGILKSEVSV